jgi:hypothetical protein
MNFDRLGSVSGSGVKHVNAGHGGVLNRSAFFLLTNFYVSYLGQNASKQAQKKAIYY